MIAIKDSAACHNLAEADKNRFKQMADIPENIKRFVLRSIASVPHLEAVLLLRHNPSIIWDAKKIAQNLFISEKRAGELLADLCSQGFTALKEESEFLYYYQPSSIGLKEMIDELSEIYAHNLVEVTNLIHSNTIKQAQKFGDAFKWQKDKE
jgi:hypothetical protein